MNLGAADPGGRCARLRSDGSCGRVLLGCARRNDLTGRPSSLGSLSGTDGGRRSGSAGSPRGGGAGGGRNRCAQAVGDAGAGRGDSLDISSTVVEVCWDGSGSSGGSVEELNTEPFGLLGEALVNEVAVAPIVFL